MKDVFIVSALRTPIGKQKGYLREWKAPQLLGAVLDGAVEQIDLDPESIDDVIAGTVYQVGEQGFTLARMGVLASGLPDTIPGIAVNRQCGSGLSAVQMGAAMIASGIMDTVIAAGCEHMTKYGIMSDMNGILHNKEPMGHPFGKFYVNKYGVPNQIVSAQKIADKWEISKEECQAFAVSSHQKAQKAADKGYFKNEILPMKGLDTKGNPVTRDWDETIRPDTCVETLESLKVIKDTKWITAGLSSTITDGASAVVLMSGDRVRALNITPLARVVTSTVAGSDPELMLTGPIPATTKILEKAGLTIDDIDIFEVNEAFAPIPLAWAKELKPDMEKLNVNGGALALGHPVGNSGCRLTITAVHELKRRKARYALVTLCTGGGMAPATIFEKA